ncbi:hypothetical protein ALC57_02341 [Trachymyrmex cornetzi]|uniref:Uncharacterized protein n=1 Tax=Trachymyrmex cornetzi TaxID=471704 RepID=A0A195EJ40_9HYME|nr:hypothetical protein ALC57_02341 [Trachymyrmex cornetzi]
MDGGKKLLLEVTRRRRRRRRRRHRRRGRRGGKAREERRRRMLRHRISRARTTCPCLPTSSYLYILYAYVACVRVCVWVGTCERTGGTYALRRSSNTRANRPGWRYRVSNGPNRKKKSRRRGIAVLFDGKQPDASGRKLYTVSMYNAGTIGLSHATTRSQRAPSRGAFDVSHTGTLGTLPTRQADVTARGNARGVSSKPEEPCRCSPCALPMVLEPDKFGFSERMGCILRIPRGRTPFSNLSLVDSFELN